MQSGECSPADHLVASCSPTWKCMLVQNTRRKLNSP